MTQQVLGRQNLSSVTTFQRRSQDYDSDLLLKLLPESIKQFVLYEVPAQAYLPTIIELVNRRGTQEALKIMRANIAKDSLKVYGPNYPVQARPVSAEDLGL